MANEQNLKTFSSSEARENGKKGGKASVKKRRERKAMKEQMEMLLSLPVQNKKNKEALKKMGIKDTDIDNQMALIVSLYQTAFKGGANSVSAFNAIMDITEEKKNNETNLDNVKEILVKIKEASNYGKTDN